MLEILSRIFSDKKQAYISFDLRYFILLSFQFLPCENACSLEEKGGDI